MKYQAVSGGFRELRDTDHGYRHWHTDIYNGLKDVKNVFSTISLSYRTFLTSTIEQSDYHITY